MTNASTSCPSLCRSAFASSPLCAGEPFANQRRANPGQGTTCTTFFIGQDAQGRDPDFCILPLGDYYSAHPSEAYLIIEVSDWSRWPYCPPFPSRRYPRCCHPRRDRLVGRIAILPVLECRRMPATEKISVTIGRTELGQAKRVASRLGISLSGFITDAVRERIREQERREAALEVVASFQPEERATPEEARALLERWSTAPTPTPRPRKPRSVAQKSRRKR